MAVNLSPIWGAGAQLFDNSGNVLSGGKIYTYAAGTTTPATTYTSSNGITANSNPIILNSAGRVPYEIWLSDTVAYKFVLKDSNDTLIATYDNLVGINSNFIAYTAQQEIQTATAGQTVFTLTTMQYQPATNNISVYVDGVNQYGPGAQYAYVETDSTTVTFVSGLHVGASVKFTTASPVASAVMNAENVAYDPPFTGAVGTNVETKLAQTVSVTDFGAVGDGVTDDTTAFQNAIDETSGNNVLLVPAGKTYLLKNLTIYNGTQIVCEGPSFTERSIGPNLLFTAPGRDTSYAIKVDGLCESIVLDGLVLQGDGTGDKGLYFPTGTTTYYSKINIGVKQFKYGAYVDGPFWGSSLDLFVNGAYIGLYRTTNEYSTSLDMKLKFVNCFHGAQLNNTLYSEIRGFMENGGLTSVGQIPVAWTPANEVPICIRANVSIFSMPYFGSENTNSMYFYIEGYSEVSIKAMDLSSDNSHTWTYDAARTNNLTGTHQGLISVSSANLNIDSWSFVHFTSGGYTPAATRQTYLFRLPTGASRNINLNGIYVNTQDYWIVDNQSALSWNNAGALIGTMSDGSDYVNYNNGKTQTWTPTLHADSVDFTGVTYTGVVAYWTRVGDLITVSGKLATNSLSGGSGNIYISLPVMGKLDVYGSCAATVGRAEAWASHTPTSGFIYADRLYLTSLAGIGGAINPCPAASAGTGTGANVIVFSATYFAA